LAEKLVFMATHGPSDPERATIPFVMALAAMASDVDVVVGLQADGVLLAARGWADGISAAEFPPMSKLLADYRELGGKLLVCNPCLKARRVDPADLADNAEIVAAARFIVEITSAKTTLTY
jgi:predicted peroxiredoxin